MAPPLVGTKGAPGHYTVLGHQPASDMAVTKSHMTRADVEEGLRVMKLALLEKEIKAREAKEARLSAAQGSKEVGKSTIPPANTTKVEDVAPVVEVPRKKGGSGKSSGKSRQSKGSRKGPKKDPKRIRGVDSDEDDDFDDDDWDEDDYDSEGNYIAGDREEGDDDGGEGEGEKPEGLDSHDGGLVADSPAAVVAAPPPEPWAVKRKRELAEKKAKEAELGRATGNRKDSVMSSLGKAWGKSEVPY